ncbi:hypothetical protein GCM10007939_26580 [Amylibacter marinus]|uniref:Polyketide cyclase / dehydrase and lipid transport n=1 Tax=Amylibacter marinus TaxID=1475483 RepID=A0ABQ5VYW0_9RHOB|nr:hypothetical protein [Amylibacter marinus]GLQ36374.1 hypothetical protein GCM10007939_26580 [Amylibacter marinus]
MQLGAKQDLNVPADFLFSELTDYPAFEALLLAAGAHVERLDGLEDLAAGMSWLIEGHFRGKHRKVNIDLSDMHMNETLIYRSNSKDMSAEITLELIELSKEQTRLAVDVRPTANTISARLILQSAKLARKSIERRFNGRLDDFCTRIEDKYHEHSAG